MIGAGGSAAVIKDEDGLDNHFNDTVGGGDWLPYASHFVPNLDEVPKHQMSLKG